MSFEDKVQRKKSTRWVRASTANYDGDDWVEEEYYEDEEDDVPPVPQLPPIPTEHLKQYEEGKKEPEQKNVQLHEEPYDDDFNDDANSFDDDGTPKINSNKFQDIDLDAPEEEEPEQEIPEERDEYADILNNEDSEEEEDYKPQSSSRFQPVPVSPVESRFEPTQPSEKAQELPSKEPVVENAEAASSSFQPFPEETQHLSTVDHKKEETPVIEEPQIQSAPEPEPEPIQNEDTQEPVDEILDDSIQSEPTGSNFQPFPAAESDHDQSRDSIEEKNSREVPAASLEQDVSESESDLIPQVEDSEDEEYVPTSNRFKSSILEQEKPTEKSLSVEGPPKIQDQRNLPSPPPVETRQKSPIPDHVRDDSNNDTDDSIQEIGSRKAEEPLTQVAPEPVDEVLDDYPQEDISKDQIEPSYSLQVPSVPPVPEPQHHLPEEQQHQRYVPEQTYTREEPQQDSRSLRVPTNFGADYSDVSDTDTLHIQDPDDPGSPSIEEIRRDLSSTSLHDATRDDNFREHAYLSSIINTPDPDDNSGTFEPRQEQHVPEPIPVESTPEPSQETSPEVQELEGETGPSDAPRTLSQYYSSVNDYFDDYADSSDNENNLKHRDSRASVRSSGSLSTGSFSIKSESRYRYSKASDRDSTLNQLENRSINSFVPDTVSEADNESQQQQQNQQQQQQGQIQGQGRGKDGNLNPALSINFGHWRPDTDSFRDQFISGTAPPLPSLDNYTRNSMGEIVEDRGSFIEASASKDKDLNKSTDELANGSPQNNEHDESTTSLDNTASTSDTDSGNLNTTPEKKNLGASYQTESKTSLPFHIPLNTPDSKDSTQGQYFHEKLGGTSTNLPTLHEDESVEVPKYNITKISGNKNTNYNMKQISGINDPEKRIQRYREARIEEANLSLGLGEWLLHSQNSPNISNYQSNVQNSHVAKAYADASTMARKHTLTNNVGSFLHKRRVFQDTSSSAQSLAKGIFTRGKKMLKNNDN